MFSKRVLGEKYSFQCPLLHFLGVMSHFVHHGVGRREHMPFLAFLSTASHRRQVRPWNGPPAMGSCHSQLLSRPIITDVAKHPGPALAMDTLPVLAPPQPPSFLGDHSPRRSTQGPPERGGIVRKGAEGPSAHTSAFLRGRAATALRGRTYRPVGCVP